jgi:hypothetical protein
VSAIARVLGVISVPLMVLNFISGFVSGIWLLVIGEWRSVLLGIAIVAVASFALGIVLVLPTLLFAGLVSTGKEALQHISVVLSSLYVGTIIVVWCTVILLVFLGRTSPRNLIPMMLWSYEVATGPWAYMASKDRDNTYSMISTVFAEVGYAVVLVMIFFGSPSVGSMVMALAACMLIGQVINWIVLRATMKSDARSNAPVADGEEGEEPEAPGGDT